jgi:hypothetical protein
VVKFPFGPRHEFSGSFSGLRDTYMSAKLKNFGVNHSPKNDRDMLSAVVDFDEYGNELDCDDSPSDDEDPN